MASRKRSAIKRTKNTDRVLVTVATQTDSDELMNDELAMCLKMIESMKLENSQLKLKLNTHVEKEVQENVMIDSVNNVGTPRSGKGCTCKGNCSSKICGCVKKNKKCQDICKCNDVKCQNQDEKENTKPNLVSKSILITETKRVLYTETSHEISIEDDTTNKNVESGGKTKIEASVDVPSNLMVTEHQLLKSPVKVEDTLFNPMIPRYQLQRTPVKPERTSLSPVVPELPLSRSPIKSKNTSLTPMIPKLQISKNPVKFEKNFNAKFKENKELPEEEVDWDKFTAELVVCHMCKRKFFPNRIDIHVKSCKKI